ncbi:5-methyltetrahydropteroyltriglutamate-homocysteine methyltransferase [Rhizoctonia solani 123E]|uniref:5-methyltetrahydropteroyltriglutamate-homocysteine methyltransferase n=1 Tax=Rhizoctonia solani 123E TaxID=1423351 RepID=A0A074RRY1_9AGAM|nr:5-methyltetrahydropteroyltriglutamate-homocysteine methyltransferase [Rhizoctonia solani 123E]
MPIPTEPIGSLPRTDGLLRALVDYDQGQITLKELEAHQDHACQASIDRLTAAGETIVTDGEQRIPSFATYPLYDVLGGTGLGKNLADGQGVLIPFADGHTRQLPSLTSGPFRFMTYASDLFQKSSKGVSTPMKTSVISPSLLSLLYPQGGISGYSKEQFLSDVCDECEKDIRQAFKAGATRVSINCTELRLALKLDPSGSVLSEFISLNNQVLDRFSEEERKNIGIHTCPGNDRCSTHSLDVDYLELLPKLFEMKAGYFLVQCASESDRNRLYETMGSLLGPEQVIFIGVTDPCDPRVETADEVRDRLLEAARHLPADRLGATDDCGFAPFGDNTSISRETAFAKIAARIQGAKMASEALGI